MTDRPLPPDPGRRDFFRRFAGDVVASVGQVIGAAQTLQAESAAAARELLGEAGPIVPPGQPASPPVDAATAGWRAPFRWDGTTCIVVDQRRLPDVIAELPIEGAADAVHAISDGIVVGALAQAQLAAIALAIAARRSRLARPYARRAAVRGAANALASTRPGCAAVRAAIDRVLARYDGLAIDADGDQVAGALREEADAIVFEATGDHGALVALALGALPGDPDAPIRLLTLGSTGAMGGGQFGTALSVVQAAHHAGRPVSALVAETRPGLEGSRIAAWELSQAGVPYAVVTDAAAPWLVASGEVDAVVVGADRIAADGDVVAHAGTYPLALAALARGVPVLVCAPTTTIDLATPDGASAILEEGRPATVLRAAGTRVAPDGSQARAPLQDVTPAALVTAIVTETGVLRPPFGPALEGSVAVAAGRRAGAPGFAGLHAAEAG